MYWFVYTMNDYFQEAPRNAQPGSPQPTIWGGGTPRTMWRETMWPHGSLDATSSPGTRPWPIATLWWVNKHATCARPCNFEMFAARLVRYSPFSFSLVNLLLLFSKFFQFKTEWMTLLVELKWFLRFSVLFFNCHIMTVWIMHEWQWIWIK